jgi:hypothetical protein
MFPRDLEIVDFLVSLKMTTGYPKYSVRVTQKNSDDNVSASAKNLIS